MIHIWQSALFKYAKEELSHENPLSFVSQHMPLKASQCAPVHLVHIFPEFGSGSVTMSARPPLGIGVAHSHRRGRGSKRVRVYPKTPTPRYIKPRVYP